MKWNPFLLKNKEYSLSKYIKLKDKLKSQGKDIIDLSIGDPKEATYKKVYEQLYQTIKNSTISSYPTTSGSKLYLQSIQAWVKRNYNVDFPLDNIISCNGSKEAIFHMALLFDWSDGKQIFIPEISYPVYKMSAEVLGISYFDVKVSRESNFLPDIYSITEEQWEKCQIFWINSPHNPTTSIASKKYYQDLISLANKYNFIICSDECYNDIYYEQKPSSLLEFEGEQNCVIFRSLSKRSNMTGFRVGAILSYNKELIENYKLIRAPIGVGTPGFIKTAAIKAWEDDEHCKENRINYLEKRNILITSLKKKGFEIFGAKGAFYLWFCHPRITNSEDIVELFLKCGIIINSGTSFGDNSGYVRMVYSETIEVIKEAAKRILSIDI